MSCFLVSWDICEKSSYYVPYKCHNRTFVASSRPHVPFDFYRRTFYYLFVYMSHTDITAGHFRHLFIHISHLSYTKGYFCPFSLYVLFCSSGRLLHRGAITTNIDKLSRRQKSSAACYITYAGTLIKLLFPKMLNVLK